MIKLEFGEKSGEMSSIGQKDGNESIMCLRILGGQCFLVLGWIW